MPFDLPTRDRSEATQPATCSKCVCLNGTSACVLSSDGSAPSEAVPSRVPFRPEAPVQLLSPRTGQPARSDSEVKQNQEHSRFKLGGNDFMVATSCSNDVPDTKLIMRMEGWCSKSAVASLHNLVTATLYRGLTTEIVLRLAGIDLALLFCCTIVKFWRRFSEISETARLWLLRTCTGYVTSHDGKQSMSMRQSAVPP